MTPGLPDEELARILDAVETIDLCLEQLVETRSNIDRAAYRADPPTQAMVERWFVKMTEATLDIGRTIITHERGSPPESNPKTMRTLGEIDVISEDLAIEMEDAARFRNVLAHTYGESINHDIVFSALQDLKRYRQFVVAVREYLDAIDALDDNE